MVSKSEILAIEWLKEQGYKEDEIVRNSNRSPDFICNDGKRFEVKYLYRNKILFSKKQVRTLEDNDNILVFDRNKLVSKFLWKDRDGMYIKIHIYDENKMKWSVPIPVSLDEAVEKAVELGKYSTKTELVRSAVRRELERLGINGSK